MSARADRFLVTIAAEFQREIAAINRLDCALVARDIAARQREAKLGRRWAVMRSKIQNELEGRDITEADWCKQELTCDITTMRRRVQLAKGWAEYERVRERQATTANMALSMACL